MSDERISYQLVKMCRDIESYMAMRLAERLEEFFENQTGEHLRSIIKYEPYDCEITYVRDDVADQYTEDELEKAVDDSRMESIASPIYADMYSEDHGNLLCMVKCFEGVVEMNFALADGVGAVVALDTEAMANGYGLVAKARNVIENERENLTDDSL